VKRVQGWAATVLSVGLAVGGIGAARAEGPKPAPVGWRGDGTGRCPAARPTLEWADGRNVQWRTSAGEGNSSPVAVGGRVFLTAEPDKLLCLDAATGKLLWQSTHGKNDLPAAARGGELEPPTECGYATPTPCSDGKDVFVLFGNGVAACYDLAGKRKWIVRIAIVQTEEHGRAASPVLVGGRLLVHVTDLFCLDAGTGATLWRRRAKAAFGTPVAVRIGQTDAVITPAGDAFRVSDGQKLADGLGSVEVASPVACEGVVYFIGSVARAVRLPAALDEKGKLQPTPLWTKELEGEFYASPVVHGGLLYAVDREGRFVVLDAATGRSVVARELEVKGDCSPSLSFAGGHVLLGTDNGVTLVLDPAGPGRLVRANALPEGSVATPAFADGRIFLRCGRDLVCVQAGGNVRIAAGPLPAGPATATTRPAPAATAPAPSDRPAGVLAGWRGNGTGLFPDAEPVLEWGRVSRGVADGLRISAAKPKADAPGEAKAIRHAYPRQWLVIGPFAAPGGLDEPALPDEAGIEPDEGARVGELAWKRCEVPEDILPPSERGTVAGAVNLRCVEPDDLLGGFKAQHAVYAHTYLHAPRGGEVELVIDHASGLKVLLNGEQLYKEPDVQFRLPWYTILSNFRTGSPVVPSPRVRLRLKQGWNRLLLKLAPGRRNHGSWKFHPRLVDLPDAPGEDRNILWAAPLPDRSNATPVIVGDRILVMAEPDELICLDKRTGRRLWRRFCGLYQAIGQAERDANPAFREKVEPLVAKLPAAEGLQQRMALRDAIHAALAEIDADRYGLKWDGHMKAHFRIVGWTLPTPCSDGRSVYVWCGNGVAACFALDGTVRWIRRVNPGEMHYPASPALVDGRFVVFAGGGFNLVALDAATGRVVWRQPAVDRCTAAVLPARIHGVGVVVTQKGDMIRASDGRVLYDNPLKRTGDTGWSPPTCLDGVVYLPWYGVAELVVNDFRGASGEQWTCPRRHIGDIPVHRDSKGRWVDRSTCCSPLIHEGICYNIDVFGTLYAVDIEAGKVLYRRDLSGELDSLTHYNAVGVAASVTLGGKHLFAMGNQGRTVVFRPGPTFEQVAVNGIARQVPRPWPIRPQEEIGYSPPLFEAARMYLRGERYFYCIGKP